MRDYSPLFSGCCCIPCPTCGEEIDNISIPGLAPTAGPPNMLGPTCVYHMARYLKSYTTKYTKGNQN